LGASGSPVILATQEAEIRRIKVRSQLRQIVHETLSQKNPSQKRVGGVTVGVSPEFKPQYCKRKKKLKASTKFIKRTVKQHTDRRDLVKELSQRKADV
jgi:transposase